MTSSHRTRILLRSDCAHWPGSHDVSRPAARHAGNPDAATCRLQLHILGQTFSLACGETLDIETLRAQLQHSGYFCGSPGNGARGIRSPGWDIDLFTMGFERPFRLDLFGSEIESIRYFDPETQRSSEKVERIDILPAREFPLTKEGIRRFRENFRAAFEGDPQLHLVYREISRGNTPAGADFYFPLFLLRDSNPIRLCPAECLLDHRGRGGVASERAVGRNTGSLSNRISRPRAPPAETGSPVPQPEPFWQNISDGSGAP